jgi:hypothetical protein
MEAGVRTMGGVDDSTPLHAAQAAAAEQDHEHPQRLDSADDEQAHRDRHRRDPGRRAAGHASWEPGTAPEAIPPAVKAQQRHPAGSRPEGGRWVSDSDFNALYAARNELAAGHMTSSSSEPTAERPGPDAQPYSISEETFTERPPAPPMGGFPNGERETLTQQFPRHFAAGYRGANVTVDVVDFRDDANPGLVAQLRGLNPSAADMAAMQSMDRPATSAEPSPAAPRSLRGFIAQNIGSTIPGGDNLAANYTRQAPGESR